MDTLASPKPRSGEDGRPWLDRRPPSRILAIRMQAAGDVTITLPYLLAVRARYPAARLDFLTREEVVDVPRAVRLFDRIDAIGGGRDERRQLANVLLRAPLLAARRYDVVLDLQNNRVSRAARRAAMPAAWSSFDRTSPVSAGERTRRAIRAAGLETGRVDARLPLVDPSAGDAALQAAGRDPDRPLVVLSPAGAFPTREWPDAYYAELARRWMSRRPAQFAIVGLPRSAARAATIRTGIGRDCLDLTGRTTAAGALGIVARAALVVTEDCGLMHMAWTSGTPTLALFGSTQHDWSAPIGPHTSCLHSGDLECGACMEPACRFGDVHCLTRYAPERVVQEAEGLLERLSHDPSRQLHA